MNEWLSLSPFLVHSFRATDPIFGPKAKLICELSICSLFNCSLSLSLPFTLLHFTLRSFVRSLHPFERSTFLCSRSSHSFQLPLPPPPKTASPFENCTSAERGARAREKPLNPKMFISLIHFIPVLFHCFCCGKFEKQSPYFCRHIRRHCIICRFESN